MSKMKPTPGPWRAWWNEAGGRFYIHAADGREVARVPNNRIEATQNADLIAQAPTLLAENERLREALETVADHCPMCAAGEECQDGDCYVVRAALALARGEGGEPG